MDQGVELSRAFLMAAESLLDVFLCAFLLHASLCAPLVRTWADSPQWSLWGLTRSTTQFLR